MTDHLKAIVGAIGAFAKPSPLLWRLISRAIGIVVWGGMLLLAGCDDAFINPKSEVVQRLQKAGGVDKVNKEAMAIFDRYRTNEPVWFFGPRLQEVPTIASLSDNERVILEQRGDTNRTCINVAYGSHRNTKVLLIYDPRRVPTDDRLAGYLQITTNIFLRRVRP
jgi:hypothetical protein